MSQTISQKILETIEEEIRASELLGVETDFNYVADTSKRECGRYPSEDEWALSGYPTCTQYALVA